MKKFLLIIGILVMFILPKNVLAEERVNIYMFYGNTCPVCERQMEYFEELEKEYDNIKIHRFETYNHEKNRENMQKVKEMYNITGTGVPFTVVGDKAIYGFNDARKERIESAIEKYSEEDYYDRVGVFLGLYKDEEIDEEDTNIESSNNSIITEEIDIKEKSNISIKTVITLICCIILVVILIISYILNRKSKIKL